MMKTSIMTGEQPKMPTTNRLQVLHNGVEIIGMSTKAKRPENDEEMVDMLRELLAMVTAPRTPAEDL